MLPVAFIVQLVEDLSCQCLADGNISLEGASFRSQELDHSIHLDLLDWSIIMLLRIWLQVITWSRSLKLAMLRCFMAKMIIVVSQISGVPVFKEAHVLSIVKSEPISSFSWSGGSFPKSWKTLTSSCRAIPSHASPSHRVPCLI